MGTRGQRSQARRESAENELVILDAGDMPHDALAVGGPHVDAETESGGERIMRSDVRALLHPLMKTVGLLLTVALGVVACLLVLLVVVRGSYAADREMTQEYSTCLGKSNGVTIEMINCILAETMRQDARLNENYKRLISKLPTERKNALVEAQRAWIKFRDANCGFYTDPEGGSAARVTANECFLNATADRAKELRLLADDP